MSENRDTGEWRTTRDRDEIREWADRHGAVPVDRSTDETAVALERDPADGRVSWDRFFDVFDREPLVFRYREGVSGGGPDHQVVGRGDLDEGGSSIEQTHEPRSVDAEQRALSDTGDSEPVAFERTGSERGEGVAEPSTTATGDAVRGPSAAADALVLDAVREHRPGLGDSQDEYVDFENAGDQPLDLSGWRVENGEGRSYRLPDGTVLEPGEKLRLHSGRSGDDQPESDRGARDRSDGDGDPGDGARGGVRDRYWGADGAVWRSRGDTVVVERSDGERVLEETYEGGRSEP